jgi:hypothetical protein
MADEQQDEQQDEKTLQAFIVACDEIGQGAETVPGMVDEVTRSLQFSQLTSISIRGSAHFRFSDDLVHTMTEAIIQCKLSIKSVCLRNHRITDVGVIQLCQLILVMWHILYTAGKS